MFDEPKIAWAPTSASHGPITILSFGGGQDSTAILYKLIYDRSFRQRYAPGDLLVVMADTGNEHPETLQHVTECARLCNAHGIRFDFLSLDRGYHSGAWAGGLVDFYIKKNAIGSVAYPKTCSSNLKIEPIRRFIKDLIWHRVAGVDMGYKSSPAATARGGDKVVRQFVADHGKIRVLLGIAAGEEKRAAKNDRLCWIRDSFAHEYPLIELGWDRAACQTYIASVGHVVPIPSACQFCPFKSAAEILWTARRYPEQFALWVSLERRKLDAYEHVPKNYGVKKLETLPEILAKAQLEYADWSDEQLEEHRMSHGHCVSTSF